LSGNATNQAHGAEMADSKQPDFLPCPERQVIVRLL
jgi:hypothetical protein